MKRLQTVLAFSIFFILATTLHHVPAWAVDATAFTECLQKSLKQNGLELSTSKSEIDDNDIVLYDVTIVIDMSYLDDRPNQKADNSDKKERSLNNDQPAPEAQTIAFDKIEELRFRNVTEDKTGNYFVKNITLPMLTNETDNLKLVIEDINLSNIKIAADNNNDPLVSYLTYESIRIGQLYFTRHDQMLLALVGIFVNYVPLQSNSKLIDITAGIDSFDYRPKEILVSDIKKWLNAVGYDKLSGSIQRHALWNLENGNYNSDRNEITINNAGKLDFSLNLEGLTEDYLENFVTLRKMLLSTERTEQRERAMMIGDLNIAVQLKIGSLKIRYDDDSLTNRILDYFAQQNNVTRNDFVSQLKATVPLIGTEINHPEFVKNTSEQVGRFLDDPKSFTISVEPTRPVSLPIIMATGQVSLAELIDLLNIKIEAKQ